MMSNDEIEGRMAFIVEHQAQFASDIQQLRESQAQTDAVVARLAHVTSEGFTDVLEGFTDVNTKINSLVDAQIRTEENLSQTDEKLRNLIAVVDRYFSEGRNGQ